MLQAADHRLRPLTFDEYLAYDDGSDTRYELEDGELVEMPTESPENNQIAQRLYIELLKHLPYYLIAHKDTELEVSGRLARCRLPDLMVHTEASFTALKGASRAIITRDMPPPALAIEVVSPGIVNRTRDYRHKYTEYAARCISEYWIVDPEERQITACQWVEGVYESVSVMGQNPILSLVVPDLKLTADQLFDTSL
ncbi:Uma2 family endonuclease [Candidatus Synechococcus calcipolaris G9]|uniref:Uma2 family endonuclease n=1 Tax=Candidatus Synechococcus calcipolaris G9 TaxID=1497997 RepID=A0ABT6EZS2_9SYNE|nr:Uma2 family endonuclease [Candidatus Synechococcus calcipolaris]MDG2991072.1 Uma2 family endonuclease [Candidatus Synechococcus calcipolaris G9]